MATSRGATAEEGRPNPFEGIEVDHIDFETYEKGAESRRGVNTIYGMATVYFGEDQAFTGMKLMELCVDVEFALRAKVKVESNTSGAYMTLVITYLNERPDLKDELELRELAKPFCTTLAKEVVVEVVREGRHHVATVVRVTFKGAAVDYYHLDEVAAELNGDGDTASVERLYWDKDTEVLYFALCDPRLGKDDPELAERVAMLLRKARIEISWPSVKVNDPDRQARLIAKYDYQPPTKSRRRASTTRSTQSAS